MQTTPKTGDGLTTYIQSTNKMQYRFSLILKSYIVVAAMFAFIISGCAQDNRKKDKTNGKGLNKLANASSPYLLQHADNPVNWHEWGPEALDKAQKTQKPLLISIGYAACHWCHVMEHESFMDTTVARLMNEHFIPIKIDREERPDIDQIYMNAAQLLTGRGGWPLNAFALPDGRPFYAGTYFPKDQWIQVLEKITEAYKQNRDKIEERAEQLTQGIKTHEMISLPAKKNITFQKESYVGSFDHWKKNIDLRHGGYGNAPKFPLPAGWEFLLQYHYLTGDQDALKAVTTTLDQMEMGGIYDQIGGGFARYSTDKQWLVPHFEKMLYDNGQLVSLYATAFKLTGKESYVRVIRETIAFIEREMSHPNGGFFASINADTEGEEGKFYVWTKQEIENTLHGDTAQWITHYYNVTKKGNWKEGKNILHRSQPGKQLSSKHHIPEKKWFKILDHAKKQLLEARAERVRPSTDDKILTSWNALMMEGYVEAYQALGNKKYLDRALQNAHFISKKMTRKNGALWRSYKDGSTSIAAFLDDYALLARAYINLYETTFEKKWLVLSKKITSYAIEHFRDTTSGMFYYTSDQSENLIARKMELADNVIPSSNSVMAHVLYKLGLYFYDAAFIEMSKSMLAHIRSDIAEGGPYYANWAKLMGLFVYKPFEVAIMGNAALEKNVKLQSHYLPTTFFTGGEEENLKLLQNKLIPGKTLIYVCRDKVCQQPVQKVNYALKQINHD